MRYRFQRYFLLITGITLALIGLAYCIDPNLLLVRYELSASGISEDNMYRGAYGGLFITVGAAIAYGFVSQTFAKTSTVIALLFMGGFALGRMASIVAMGLPHQMIMNLFVFEVVSTALFLWFLVSEPTSVVAES